MEKLSKFAMELGSKHLYETASSQEKEVHIASAFLERLQLKGAIEIADKPDIFVSLGNDNFRIGIELTQLCADANRNGSAERERQAHWKKIAELLRSRLRTEKLPLQNAYGSVFFKHERPMDKPKLPSSSGEIKDFCEQIVTVLRAVKLNEAGQEIRNLNEAPLLDKFVEHIWVRVFPGQDSLLWFCSDLQTGIIVNPLDMIIQSVKSKRMKALNYDWRGAQERWLLIYAAGRGCLNFCV